jgi:predicted 2-oxoglutarate/Fe(II)-dependent dioxygenase YbiX
MSEESNDEDEFSLELRNEDLTEIPDYVFERTDLKELYIMDNHIYEIPPEIGDLKGLKKLFMIGNDTVKISKEIGRLVVLKKLELYDNKIEELPKEIGNLKALKVLDLQNNKIKELPKEIGGLVSIRDLFLSYNQLKKIPSEISSLLNLQHIDLSYNQLIEIPVEIGDLVFLKSLDLSHNQLIDIPKEIGNISCLEMLCFQKNKLTSLPMTLIRLRNLRIFHIDDNPIKITNRIFIKFMNRIGPRRPAGPSEEIVDSLFKILSEEQGHICPYESFIMNNEVLSERCKQVLMDYTRCVEDDDFLGVSFIDVFEVIVGMIMRNKVQNEMLKVLNEQFSSVQENETLTNTIVRLLVVIEGQNFQKKVLLPKEFSKKYAYSLDNVLTKEECLEWIKESEEKGYEPALINIGNGLERYIPEVRNSYRCMIDTPQKTQMIYDRIKFALPETWYNKKIVGINERLRFLRYDPGEYFEGHYDGSYETDKHISRITVQIYLNEDYEGGLTTFLPDRDQTDVACPYVHKTGSALLFEHQIYHEGSEVTKGRKYAVRTDVLYMKD